MKLIDNLLLITGAIYEGVVFSIDAPHRFKLSVDHDYEVRRERERREVAERLGRAVREKVEHPLDVAQPHPSIKFIHLNCTDRAGGLERTFPCTIVIDLETRQIDWSRTTAWLLRQDDHGSGSIGAILIAMPAIILMSPVIFALRNRYERQEKKTGMSRHADALLKAIRSQLDEQTEALLVEALQNTWAHEQAMSRKISFEEAKTLLSGCDLREDVLVAVDEPDMRDFHWFDDEGNNVAEGGVFGGAGGDYVRVLGSRFKGDEADALIVCYRNREEDRIE